MTIKIIKPAASDDPYHPENLKVPQSFIDSAGVKKLLTTIPVRKPKKQDFIRVHPDADYRADVAIIEIEEDRESYLVTPNTVNDLQNELTCKTLFTAINRQGVLFLWPVQITTMTFACSNGIVPRAKVPRWPWANGFACRRTWAWVPTKCSKPPAPFLSRNGRARPFRKCCASPSATASSTGSTIRS
jgi:hypothetical protein